MQLPPVPNAGLSEADINIDPSPLVTPEQIQSARNYCQDPANATFIQEMVFVGKAIGTPFGALTPEKTGLSHRIEYYGPDRIFLKYDKAFTQGVSKITSKVVEIVSGYHFAETLAVKEGCDAENYYAAKENFKRKSKRNLPKGRLTLEGVAAIRVLVNTHLKDVREVMKESFYVEYTKMFRTRTITKMLSYSVLYTGIIKPDIFPAGRESELARFIVRAVANYHRKGYFHNDLKGANFLWRVIAGQIVVKIIDFDMSKPTNSQSGTTKGTPLYIAPEIIKIILDRDKGLIPPNEHPPAKLNAPKESWALGITLLKDVYNVVPIWVEKAKSRQEMYDLYIANPNPDFSRVPAFIRPVIQGLLTQDPEKRLTVIQADQDLSLIP